MTLLLQTEEFNPDDIPYKIIGIASEMVMHDSGFHSHLSKSQLLYAPEGCMTVTTEDTQFVLPPFRLLWIPAGEIHRVNFRNVVSYRSVYFDKDYAGKYFDHELKVLYVNPLLKEIIERVCFWDNADLHRQNENIIKVFWDEMNASPEENLKLKMPHDTRLKKIVEDWTLRNSLPPRLKGLSGNVGAGEKTIGRIFRKETGLSYQDWRQQWRLLRAIELLVGGNSIGEVSYQLEFSSDSAFIDFFKKQTGSTPLQYLMKNR